MKSIALPALLILSLAACNNETTPTVENTEGADTPPPVVNESPRDVTTPPGPTTSPATPPIVPPEPDTPANPDPLKSIPSAFQGTWDFTAADCKQSSSVGRLKISANELQFHESHATITRVEAKSATEITAFGKFEGEGQSWDGNPTFTLDGGKLRMSNDGVPANESSRVKCS